jgi:hypothetical protein
MALKHVQLHGYIEDIYVCCRPTCTIFSILLTQQLHALLLKLLLSTRRFIYSKSFTVALSMYSSISIPFFSYQNHHIHLHQSLPLLMQLYTIYDTASVPMRYQYFIFEFWAHLSCRSLNPPPMPSRFSSYNTS